MWPLSWFRVCLAERSRRRACVWACPSTLRAVTDSECTQPGGFPGRGGSGSVGVPRCASRPSLSLRASRVSLSSYAYTLVPRSVYARSPHVASTIEHATTAESIGMAADWSTSWTTSGQHQHAIPTTSDDWAINILLHGEPPHIQELRSGVYMNASADLEALRTSTGAEREDGT